LLQQHADGAGAAGMILGVYHWDDPNCTVERQKAFFLEKTSGIPYRMAVLDMEQDWKSWTEWKKKEITQRFDPAKLCVHGQALDDAVRREVKAPVIIYTRQTWVLEYAPAMVTWLANRNAPLWLALYLKKQGVPEFGEFPWSKRWPEKARNLKFWQFSDGRWKLPGVSQALDLNLWGGTLEELRGFCGMVPSSPALPPEGEGGLSLEGKVEILVKGHPELFGGK